MTYTYGPGIDTDLNKTRLLIFDTNSTDAKFEDEELNQFLDMSSNPFGAAALAARTMQARTAGQASKTVGELKIELSGVSKGWAQLANDLEAKSRTGGSPRLFAGGISVSGKNTEEADTDRVEPAFSRDQFAFPDTNLNSSRN